MYKMLIGADVVPTETNFDLFEKGDINTLAGEELAEVLKDADFRIFNLETPICDEKAPIPKYGPNLIAPIRTMPGLKVLNPSLLALANNHILDQGDQGLFTTLEQLRKWDIPYMGVGKNLEEAKKPLIIEANGKKIGIYNGAEHEFTIAEENKAGANPFDLFESFDEIARLKEKCDFVIVLYHGGREEYRYPSPYLKKVCRKAVEKGADLVICQHTHCIGCEERYNGGVIVYGQGNFHFDHSNKEEWQTSLLVKATFGDEMSVEYIPIVKCGNVIRLADSDKAKEIMEGFNRRSEEIKEKGFIEKAYSEYAMIYKQWYLYCLAGGKATLNCASNEFFPEYTMAELLPLMNYYMTEPHMEVINTIIKELIKKETGEKE